MSENEVTTVPVVVLVPPVVNHRFRTHGGSLVHVHGVYWEEKALWEQRVKHFYGVYPRANCRLYGNIAWDADGRTNTFYRKWPTDILPLDLVEDLGPIPYRPWKKYEELPQQGDILYYECDGKKGDEQVVKRRQQPDGSLYVNDKPVEWWFKYGSEDQHRKEPCGCPTSLWSDDDPPPAALIS